MRRITFLWMEIALKQLLVSSSWGPLSTPRVTVPKKLNIGWQLLVARFTT